MAEWRFSDIGTRVQATGASDTGVDWGTAANEFPMSEAKSVYDGLSDGDEMVFLEDTTYDIGAGTAFNGLTSTESVTIRSRTPGERYTWNLTADVQVSFSGGAGTIGLSVTGLDITADVTMTQERYIFFSGGIGDLTTDIRFRDHTVTNSNTSTIPAGLDHVSNRAGTKTVNVKLRNVTFNQNQAAFIRDNSSAGAITFLVDIQDSAQTSATTSGTDGWFWLNQANNVNLALYRMLDNTMAITGANGVLRMGAGHIQSSALTVGTLDCQRNTVTATTAGTQTRGFIHTEGATTVDFESVIDNHIVGPGNHIGMAVTAGTTSGSVVVNYADVHGNSGAYGVAAYGTAGGSVEVKAGKVHDNDWGGTGVAPYDISEGLAIYGGGSGDCIVGAVAMWNNTGSGTGSGGLDVFMVHNLTTSPSNDATYKLQNATCLSGGSEAAVVCQNSQAISTNGDTNTLTIDNVVIGGAGLVLIDSAQSGTDSLLNTTIRNSSIASIDRTNHTVSSYSNTGGRAYSPNHYEANGRPRGASNVQGRGVKWWTGNRLDAVGRLLRVPPSIGAYEATYGAAARGRFIRMPSPAQKESRPRDRLVRIGRRARVRIGR